MPSHTGETWCVDLLDMTGNRTGSHRGYALVAVDLLTRRQWWELMLRKTGEAISEALRAMGQRAGGLPQKIWSDKESGIVEVTRDLGVELYHTREHAWLAENAIRWYRERLPRGKHWKEPISSGEYEREYNANNRMTSLGGKTPNELANMKREEVEALHEARRKLLEDPNEGKGEGLVVGSRVLRRAKRGTFVKGSVSNRWDPRVWVVSEVNRARAPTMYRVEGLPDNKFYRAELKLL
jgi:hypothetical protein